MTRPQVLITGGLLLLLAILLRGYVPIHQGTAAINFFVSWPANGTIACWRNSQIGPAMPNLDPGSLPVAAIDAAFVRGATEAGLGISLNGPTPVTDAALDGISIVSFANTAANQALLMGALATTVSQYLIATPVAMISEFDIIVSGYAPISTRGTAGWFDIETIIAHEVAHGLGMDHTPTTSATLFHNYYTGSIRCRDYSIDDLAGIHAQYGRVPPSHGAVAGSVVRAGGVPVPGAHVFLADVITGRVSVGGLTDPSGTFTLNGVPPGIYHLFAEPLDGPMTPANLTGTWWTTAAPDTTFRSNILGTAGGGATVLAVHPGQTVNAGTFTVSGPPPVRNVSQVFFNNNPVPLGSISTLEQTAPYTGYLGVFGTGINLVPASGFMILGPFVQITGPSTWVGSTPTYSDRIFPVAVPSGCPPGAFVLWMNDPQSGEVVVFPGCLEILPGPQPEVWSTAYGNAGVGSAGTVNLARNGAPALGNSAFSVTLSGVPAGATAFFVFATAPDWVVLGPNKVVAVDIATSVLPLTALAIPVSGGSLTLPLPIPNVPAAAGLEIFLQALVTDPGVTGGFTLSNAVAVHIG